MAVNTTMTNYTDSMNGTVVQHTRSDGLDIITYCICFFALFANALSITATVNIPHRQSTHSKLIISLGVSDCLIVFGVIYHYLISIFMEPDNCVNLSAKMFVNTALLATLINLLAMAFDHYFAIMKPLHYRRFMSRYRGNCLVLIIWGFSVFAGFIDIFVGMMINLNHEQFCRTILSDDFELELVILGVIILVLIGICAVYSKIYSLVKKLMSRDQMLYQDEMHSHKAIMTTILIIGSFVFCWLPDCLFQITMAILNTYDREAVFNNQDTIALIHKILFALLLSNSLCDPIIYAVRLSEVQKGYKEILYKIFPRQRYSANEEEFRNLNHNSDSGRRRSTATTLVHDTQIFNSNDNIIKQTSDLDNNLLTNILQNANNIHAVDNNHQIKTQPANKAGDNQFFKNSKLLVDAAEYKLSVKTGEDMDNANETTKMVTDSL